MSDPQPTTVARDSGTEYAHAVSRDGMVSWHHTQENIWCADDGQSFVAREDDGYWYAYLDDESNRRRGPFGSAFQAMTYAS